MIPIRATVLRRALGASRDSGAHESALRDRNLKRERLTEIDICAQALVDSRGYLPVQTAMIVGLPA